MIINAAVIGSIASGLSLLANGTAAYLWFLASRIRLPVPTLIPPGIYGGLSRLDEHVLIDVLSRSNRLNAAAAIATGAGALLSAIVAGAVAISAL